MLLDESAATRPIEFSSEIIEAADKVTYITNHIKSENDYEEVIEFATIKPLFFKQEFIIKNFGKVKLFQKRA